MELDEAWWSNHYITGATSWDKGEITTPLKDYIDQLTDKDIAILIPGCGNSYEAEYLLQRGFANITLIDISATLCKSLEVKFAQWLDSKLKIICADFFSHTGQYDLVIEQTFFCALSPGLRTAYADKMYGLLKTSGKLVGLLFNKDFAESPPFGGNIDEYTKLFQQKFKIEIMETCYNSITPRKDAELFIKLRKP